MRGEVILITVILILCAANAHTEIISGWAHFNPNLINSYKMHLTEECIDEKLRDEDSSSWCEHKTNAGYFIVEYTVNGFQGNWKEVTGIEIGCSGTGSGYQNGVWAWNYDENDWSNELGSCGAEGENYWQISDSFFKNNKIKIKCSAEGGQEGAGLTAELFVNKVYYRYNTFPTANPEIKPKPFFAGQNLTIEKNFIDLDGDEEQNSSIRWFVNGEEKSNEKTLNNTKLFIGDVVTLEYIPCDSYGHCGQTYSKTATVQNKPPVFKKKVTPEKVRGGTEQVFYFEAEETDENQTVNIFCSINNSTNNCSGIITETGFECILTVPEKTQNNSINCFLDDGFNKTFYNQTFETDITPPTTGRIKIENKNNFTKYEKPKLNISSENAFFMRFACKEENLNQSQWMDFAKEKNISITENPGCNKNEGKKQLFVEFKDEVGNKQIKHANNTVFLDLTPPTTSDSSDNKIHLPGYKVNLTENDSHDPTNVETFYCTSLNNTCNPTKPFNSSIKFTERGENLLKYLSKDSAGNQLIIEKIIRINLLPEAEVEISPSEPTKKSGIKCFLTNITNEKEQNITPSYTWYKNGFLIEQNNSKLTEGFEKNDNITCKITPHDGMEKGLQKNKTVRIKNSPPEIKMSIEETNSITCVYNTTDPDGDSLEINQTWLKNGKNYSKEPTIEDKEMEPGDSFTCKVTATDGQMIVTTQEKYVTPKPTTISSSGGSTTSSSGTYGGSSSGVVLIEKKEENKEENKTEINFEKKPTEKKQEKRKEEEKKENETEIFKPEPIETQPIEKKPTKQTTALITNSPTIVIIAILTLTTMIIAGLKLPIKNKTKKFSYERIKQKWSEYPQKEEEQEKLILEIARELEKNHGSFHGAGVYKTMERVYGKELSSKRISTEKRVNKTLRENPKIKFKEKVGRKKLYTFQP